MSKRKDHEAPITSVALLKREAAELLASFKKKPIVAIDLDYTIWPALCADHTTGPYKPCRQESTADSGPGKLNSLFCTDKRNSSARLLSLFPESRDVLEWCLDNNVVLTVCSRSPNKEIVQEILTAFEMWEWFFEPQIFPQRKINHFCNLVEAAKCEFTEFLFFDDDAANVSLCSQMGISGCVVRKSLGLNWHSFVKGLNIYNKNEHARLTLRTWISAEHSRQNSVDRSVTQNSSCYTTDNEAPEGDRRAKYARLDVSEALDTHDQEDA